MVLLQRASVSSNDSSACGKQEEGSDKMYIHAVHKQIPYIHVVKSSGAQIDSEERPL